ncbi:MAG: hypothetical protein HC862_32580 [Scytonema sp. RU_4_4]|nr:hypothetical protein [Scytonema sp. RU_4_4]NJR73801.1 hypothetical protein [Scytonema sp. CRU_2_7]
MSERDNLNPRRISDQPLHNLNLSNYWCHSESSWCPRIEKIIEGRKQPIEKEEEKQPLSTVKGLCLFVSVLALLSFGLCIQADALAQALQEVAIISIRQTIPIEKY